MAATVYISSTHSNIPEALVQDSSKSIFKTNMDLMVFAAMVGASKGVNYKKFNIESQGKEVNESVFLNSKKEGVVYLTALVAEKNGDILREENNSNCWKIFENFAESGFQEINNWLLDSPGLDRVDLLLGKMKQEARKHVVDDEDIDLSSVSF
ncbi:hypothetical protein EOL70_15055 [Leucothrix sargassi]|nr:hypothetical protein EOL70_15055 [Leucothrix sargassi]